MSSSNENILQLNRDSQSLNKGLLAFAILFSLLCMPLIVNAQSGVSIGKSGNAPSQNAILDIVSGNKGILIPRMTTLERISIAPVNNENGLLVYDTYSETFWYWNGIDWEEISGGESSDNQNLYLSSDSILIENGTGIPYDLIGDYLYLHITDSILTDNNFINNLGDILSDSITFISNLSDSLFFNQQFSDSLLSFIYTEGGDTLLYNHEWLIELQNSIDTDDQNLSLDVVNDSLAIDNATGVALKDLGLELLTIDTIITVLVDTLLNDTTLGINALQNEIDTTQKYAGLDANGKYVTKNYTNYIDGANSLDSADVLLDKRIKYNLDSITIVAKGLTSNVLTELDTTQKYVGLDADGKYIAKNYTNYIDGANSLDSANVLLDARIKMNADSIASLNQIWEKEIENDDDNNLSVPFTLKKNTVIFFNGAALRKNQWSGIGTTTLNLALSTKKYDFILINNN